jgi:hypothetical protein
LCVGSHPGVVALCMQLLHRLDVCGTRGTRSISLDAWQVVADTKLIHAMEHTLGRVRYFGRQSFQVQ